MPVRLRVPSASVCLWICLGASAVAQFRQPDSGSALLGESQVQRWRAGVIVTAASGPCRGIVGTVPIPIDWPEQQVTIAEEEFSPAARVRYQMVEGTVKLMVVSIPHLAARQEAKALVTLEIRRSAQLPPEDTDVYGLPDKWRLERAVRPYLGPSPYIESTSSKIRALAKQIGADKENAWEKVEAIYDWVRENVEYTNGPLKGALAALNDGTGDCEELTSLFIAICRASGIPARTVWVPDHCYPEFYLVDQEGKGHWFPCQVAGTRSFGGIPEYRPILQKGDNFRDPQNRRERKRYLAESLIGVGGKPQVKFVRELLAQ